MVDVKKGGEGGGEAGVGVPGDHVGTCSRRHWVVFEGGTAPPGSLYTA